MFNSQYWIAVAATMFLLTPILNIVFKYEKVKIKLIITDAIRLWNKLPTNITLAPTLATAKKASKAFVKALPA